MTETIELTRPIYTRDCGVGFGLNIDPAEQDGFMVMTIFAQNGKIKLDEVLVPKDKTLDAINHPVFYSAKFREALV